jgi:HSP20 family molecular chaperone IbpA
MRARDDEFIRDIRHLQETMERLLADFSHLRMPLLLSKESVWRPLTDVYETEDEFVVRTEIPGMEPKDFSITLEGHMLIIRGVRRDPTRTGKRHFHKMEITLGPFERDIEIPSEFHIASVEAGYENGFLTVRVARGGEDLKVGERTIPVERGT